jgi:hypothetical protein
MKDGDVGKLQNLFLNVTNDIPQLQLGSLPKFRK